MINNLKESYYYNGLLLANSFCLVLFYLSCNYLVVRELSVEFLGNEVLPGQDIPFAYFFYAFTFIVPVVYLVQSLKTKDRIMLWISFLAIAFSFYTIGESGPFTSGFMPNVEATIKASAFKIAFELLILLLSFTNRSSVNPWWINNVCHCLFCYSKIKR